MSNRDVIDQMAELLLAGSETTSGQSAPLQPGTTQILTLYVGTVGCLFLEIARNPKVKQKLLASLPVLRPEDEIMDSKLVREDPRYRYLEACIKENLRMHPIASEMGRRTLDFDYSVDDFEIPAYTVVSASYRRLHNSEDHWPQADRFWPERWLEGDEREDAPEPE